MDNITHTLIGVTVAHSFSRDSKPEFSRENSALIWSSIFANNLPDADFVFRFVFPHEKFGYLLHHRGYSHTFLLIPVLAAIAALLGSRIARTRITLKIVAISLLGVFLHIAADFCNDYGVHPLSPFNQHWFYGDFMFILEPTLWLAMLPLAFLRAKRLWTKALAAIAGIGLLGVAGYAHEVPKIVAFGLLIWAMIFLFLQLRTRKTWPAWLGVCVSLSVFLIQANRVSALVKEDFARNTHDEKLINLVRTPAPADPLCWRVIATSVSGERYFARFGIAAFLPTVISHSDCFSWFSTERRPPLVKSVLADTPVLFWVGDYVGSFSELERLAREDCHVNEVLHFDRVPFVYAGRVGDLRFDYARGRAGFSSARVGDPSPCMKSVPGWVTPLSGEFR